MKTANDPRHRTRQFLVQELFRVDFHTQKVSDRAKAIFDRSDTIDAYIHRAAPEYPIDKINRTDLAILRLAVYEIKIEKKEPNNVIIDEAIELAKEFGGEASPAFINGALGKLISDEKTTDIQK
jgi:transcription antitermination protein NusB